MIKNYFTIAWRNMTRNKVNSLINIAGLAIGMACVILILFYVQDELGFDKFFKQSDHIFQVNVNADLEGSAPAAEKPGGSTDTRSETEFLTGNTPPPVGPALVSEFPEVEAAVRIYRPNDVMIRRKEGTETSNFFTENGLIAVDSNFFQVFTYKIKEGNPATCLQDPASLVLTERASKKYFGDQPAIGKILLFGSEQTPFTVTGVLKNIPAQSSLQFEMLAPIAAFPVVKRFTWSWVWLQVNTYIRLRDNTPVTREGIAKLEAKFPAMVKKYGSAGFRRVGRELDEVIRKGGKWDLQLQPLTSVHLYALKMRTDARLTTLGNIKYVYIFSIIALFIIILACVNFTNLSTAQSAKRAKEIGVRKVLGSNKPQLIKQFLAEAMLYSMIAAFIAIVLVLLFLDPFNSISGKSLSPDLFLTGNVWMFIAGLTILTGLISGIYPAFFLTSFKPVTVLKGMKLFKSGPGRLFVRNGLVVFQFTTSTVLIICTIIVFRQLKFTQKKDLGFSKENVVVIANANRLENQEETFRQELTKLPGVISASASTGIPTRDNFGDDYTPEPGENNQDIDKDIALSSFMVDDDFTSTLRMQVIKGRTFSKDFSDSASVLLNETAAKQIGWKDPVGQYMQYPGNGNQRFKVIGVVKDFNIESLRNMVVPFALFHLSSKTYGAPVSYISIRVRPGNIKDQLDRIETKWKSFAAGIPFDYSFLDSNVEALYRSEKRMGTVIVVFTFLSLFVACLGLFGLVAYTAEKRTKEIGIRKVLGASVPGIVAMLSKDFLKLTIIAALIAFPIAWYFMNKWLQDFAYRIDIGWWVFAVAGILALLIALLTVSFRAIKAAIANPVKSLRTE